VIGVAKSYEMRPSELLGIPDAYTAYCFDEACAVIAQKVKDGEEPIEKTHYTSPSQLFRKYGGA
jgi:hypothetical protein